MDPIRADLAKGIDCRIVLVGTREQRNVSVSDLRLATAFAVLNRPSGFNVRVTNFGTAEGATCASASR